MIQPADALAGSLGIAPAAGPDGPPQRSAPQLFTAALLRAGRNGCECECCKLMMAVADLMVDQAESPFPAKPDPAPAAAKTAPTPTEAAAPANIGFSSGVPPEPPRVNADQPNA